MTGYICRNSYWSYSSRPQFNASDDTIPVALRLVGNAMGVLANADVFNAVVDTDANGVLATEANERSDVVLVWSGERQLVTDLTAVDKYRGLDVWTFEIKQHGALLP